MIKKRVKTIKLSFKLISPYLNCEKQVHNAKQRVRAVVAKLKEERRRRAKKEGIKKLVIQKKEYVVEQRASYRVRREA